MSVYYNENDPGAAAWLRALISAGMLPKGDVDDRSIAAVSAGDVAGYAQAHFFAGIGGWPHALALARWPAARPIWTGSCPCQPFSNAGAGRGEHDPRHLWPDFLRLIRARRPPVVMGEQVAAAAGYGWLDGVRADLARENYTCRGVDIPACAVDAPHIRNRLYWIALADAESLGGRAGLRQTHAQRDGLEPANGYGGDGVLDLPGSPRLQGIADASWLGDAAPGRANAERTDGRNRRSFWQDAEWIECHDGRARRTEPGARLLAHGVPGRVVKWRGLGNAIVPPLAAEVVAAFLDAEREIAG